MLQPHELQEKDEVAYMRMFKENSHVSLFDPLGLHANQTCYVESPYTCRHKPTRHIICGHTLPRQRFRPIIDLSLVHNTEIFTIFVLES